MAKKIKLTLETGDLYYHEFRDFVQILQKTIHGSQYEIEIKGNVAVDAHIDGVGYGMN